MSAPEKVELSPEERCERVRMALAEAGYPDASVWWDDEFPATNPGSVRCRNAIPIPLEVTWRAFAIAAPDVTSCWPCWDARDPLCTHDPLTSPWPEVVR